MTFSPTPGIAPTLSFPPEYTYRSFPLVIIIFRVPLSRLVRVLLFQRFFFPLLFFSGTALCNLFFSAVRIFLFPRFPLFSRISYFLFSRSDPNWVC